LSQHETPQAADPFDPASLRLSQDFGATVGVKKALLTIPVKKPAYEWYVRTHPDEAYWMPTEVIELTEDREIYLVAQSLWSELATEKTFSPRLLVTTQSRQGVIFLWPLKLPRSDGRHDEWSRSALEASQMARSKWVRVVSNSDLGAYDAHFARTDLPDPIWPKEPFKELLRIAFRDKFIDNLDHVVLRKLRGEL
jgi:hypothetical protein